MMARPRRFLESLVRPWLHREDRVVKEEENLEAIAAKEQKVFKYDTLVAATHNFHPQQKLGEGGFGPVFRGRLEDGREVAVKRLGRGSTQGVKAFTNEAILLSQVHHKNVVNLYGYCARADEKLLVYEYVPNESLDKFLFSPLPGGGRGDDPGAGRNWAELLDWNRRYEVVLGVARGLLYLHEDAHTPIIHRDIKPSNILLDERWSPKIADFGLSRLFPEDLTHVNTRVTGTFGYMAPEYVMHGSLSTKSDVFSFGVLVLELISGRKNSSFILKAEDAQSLPEWAWKLYKKGQSLELMDPVLRSTAVPEQVAMCVHIGLLCTQSDPKLRPDMKRVVVILSKRRSTLEEPIRPGIPGSRYQRRAYGPQSSNYALGESLSGTIDASNSASSDASTSKANSKTTTSTITTNASSQAPHLYHEQHSIQH
ncbi:cysteine-rich receptor-like protein kinase 43 isoform X1 [Elaeis guineensis]|uniref:Receptor-like protein kinase At4g00960 isoform X1 n=1 Tax=Elaeis guineensis var. tenera TaxID=51953 RepID=A0A8N4IAL1_ELAGV|nr:putative receptor-like protein kinase At4g00960 isoform X1 [Elaeis guineensis]